LGAPGGTAAETHVSKPATYNLIFNAVGALVGVTVVGYIAWSLFQVEHEEPCRARYPAPTRFSLATSAGAPLSPIELQGRAGLGEWGVLDNTKVVPTEEAPGTALEVKLASVTNESVHSARQANGVDFRWMPLGMKSATAACLDYSVFIPEKFPFNEEGGALPGVFGGPLPPDKPGDANRFAVRLQWTGDGKGILYVAPAGSPFRGINLSGFALEPGHWMRMQQEVVLNTPGEANGIVRLWADGELKAEDKGVDLRKDKADGITGVLVDVGYLRQPGAAASLRFSPFEISWR
jgi:Polysaccharide lyase 14